MGRSRPRRAPRWSAPRCSRPAGCPRRPPPSAPGLAKYRPLLSPPTTAHWRLSPVRPGARRVQASGCPPAARGRSVSPGWSAAGNFGAWSRPPAAAADHSPRNQHACCPCPRPPPAASPGCPAPGAHALAARTLAAGPGVLRGCSAPLAAAGGRAPAGTPPAALHTKGHRAASARAPPRSAQRPGASG